MNVEGLVGYSSYQTCFSINTVLRSKRPSKEYMKPLRMNVEGLVGYSSYQTCFSINTAFTPPSRDVMLKTPTALSAASRYSCLPELRKALTRTEMAWPWHMAPYQPGDSSAALGYFFWSLLNTTKLGHPPDLSWFLMNQFAPWKNILKCSSLLKEMLVTCP